MCNDSIQQNQPLGVEIKILSVLFKRRADQIFQGLAPSGIGTITANHMRIIAYLYQNRHRKIYQREIEEVFCIRRSTVTQVLRLMERNKLVRRKPAEEDARLNLVWLTPKALMLHKQGIDTIQKIEEETRKGISDEELAIFMSVLSRMKANLMDSEEVLEDSELFE